MNSHLYYPSKHKTSPQFCFDVEDSRPTLEQNLGQCLIDPGTADNDVNWINCFKIKKVIHNRCRFTFNVQYRHLQVQVQEVHVYYSHFHIYTRDRTTMTIRSLRQKG